MKHKMPIIDVKKYGGLQVAIVDGKIIASGKTLSRVLAMAQRRVPLRPLHDIRVFAVPRTLSVIYYQDLRISNLSPFQRGETRTLGVSQDLERSVCGMRKVYSPCKGD